MSSSMTEAPGRRGRPLRQRSSGVAGRDSPTVPNFAARVTQQGTKSRMDSHLSQSIAEPILQTQLFLPTMRFWETTPSTHERRAAAGAAPARRARTFPPIRIMSVGTA